MKVYFNPEEKDSPAYKPSQNEAWYDTLLDSNSVMECVHPDWKSDQIQGARAPECNQ